MSASTPRSSRPDDRVLVLLVLGLALCLARLDWSGLHAPEDGVTGEGARPLYVWKNDSHQAAGLYRIYSREPTDCSPVSAGPFPADREEGRTEAAAGLPPQTAPFFFRPIPLNTADQELLATLPGIGPKLAARIVSFREQRGKFKATQELLSVKGIGSVKLTNILSRITIEPEP